jgi:hypothetical protein
MFEGYSSKKGYSEKEGVIHNYVTTKIKSWSLKVKNIIACCQVILSFQCE